jgi:apolipoprotein N-acyltransferase
MELKKHLPLILFILGFGIFIFTRLSKLVPTIPIAILISFVFILRFSRTQPAKRGILLTLLGFILSINIGLWGLFEMVAVSSLLFNLIRSSLLAVLYFLPFMADRLIYPKFKKNFLSTLIFPIITTAIFYLLTIEGPFEGAIQPAKFAFGTIEFMQFLSLFGVFGFVFVTSWFASAINHLWEMKFDWKKSKKLVLILLSVVLIMFIFGTIKVHMLPKADTVKVAAIIIDPDWGKDTLMEKVFTDRITSSFEETLAKIENKTKIAVSNDAKIVSFMELAIIINEEKHDELRDELKRIAQENNVYLTMTYGYYVKDGKGKNIHLLIDNNGEILLDYQKRYLAGIGELGEKGVFVIGPEIIQSVDTPYGKIGLSVCRDMEMSKYIIQAAKAGVDIMFSSSYEWPKTWLPNNLQTPIVNGFSFVRPTYNGVTHIQDYNGKILNQMHFEETETGIMYADVPTKGVKTLYSYVGKLIGWLSALGLLGLIVLAIKKR